MRKIPDGARERAQRSEWLARRIKQVEAFIERDTLHLREDPDSFVTQITLRSWQQHCDELKAELEALNSGIPGGH